MTDNLGATLLVVDDTPQNLSLISDIVEPYFTVKLANSGARALAIIASKPVDLVLLDIMMPDMDGYEVCRRIKAGPTSKHIPVVFVTTIAEKEGKEDWQTLGASDYVTKPVDPDVLLIKIRNALSGKG